VNEEYDEIPSRVSLPHRGVDVFAFAMAALDESKLRLPAEDLDNLVLVNSMLSKQLIQNFIEPDETDDLQSRALP
jgi:hypothetical protein